MDFGFSYEIDRDLFDRIASITRIEHELRKRLSEVPLGSGVKSATAGIVAFDANKSTRRLRIRKPKYRQGIWETRELGVLQRFEDTLEFDIKASAGELRNATDDVKVARVLKQAFGLAYPDLLALAIRDFAAAEFVDTIDRVLNSYENRDR
jgi:hypothetical protein